MHSLKPWQRRTSEAPQNARNPVMNEWMREKYTKRISGSVRSGGADPPALQTDFHAPVLLRSHEELLVSSVSADTSIFSNGTTAVASQMAPIHDTQPDHLIPVTPRHCLLLPVQCDIKCSERRSPRHRAMVSSQERMVIFSAALTFSNRHHGFDKSGVVVIVLLVLQTVVNVTVLQLKMMWGFTLVSSSARLEVTAHSSEVVDHFIETVQLRSQLIELILNYLDEIGESIDDLLRLLQSWDPDGTGLIDVDDMRELLRRFGAQLSFFGFNSVARLVFDLKGTIAVSSAYPAPLLREDTQ